MKLKVGQIWRNRDGYRMEITTVDNDGICCCIDACRGGHCCAVRFGIKLRSV